MDLVTFKNIFVKTHRNSLITKPPCKNACPVNAISQRPDGIVLIHPEACIGCKDCIEAYPFGVMQFDSENGIAEKCHLCYQRIDRGERPACVDKCIGRCIYFGTIEELLVQLGEKRWKLKSDEPIL